MAEDKGNQGAAEAAKASGAGNLEKSAASRPAPETGVEVRAVAKYVRMAPRKLRLVARNILAFSLKRAARTMARVLGSAIANAENNKSLDSRDMVVYRAFVDEGPTGKGWTPRARGRASQVHKRTSHVTIVVKEREGVR
jgi:large subunit ribosomal protein L22